ncbi:MAG: chloride channel protein [Rhodospirillales bacterium]|nr:MAG: chloride channel protein [Rhodospirillales bacterium]
MLERLDRVTRHEQVILSVLAVVIGAIGGGSAIAFREALAAIQFVFYGFAEERVATLAGALPWWHILAATTLGGLAVGLIVAFVMPGRRPQGVADVMQACALRGGRMSLRGGLAAALVSAVSLGAGASTGREGPVVHLGASLSAFVAERLRLGRSLSQTLLGCGVAAAVAASFNAPIAGAFFALEVVVGHYAMSAFAAIVIASVTGTIVSRIWFGDYPAFIIPEHSIASFLEFPAFALLGLVSAATAVIFMYSVDLASRTADRIPVPAWLRPACGGLLVGIIALAFPQVLGVGYEATDTALRGQYGLTMLFLLLMMKTTATAISLGSGFGGGVFSPSLYLGAMLGGVFGILATHMFPHLSSGHAAYTIVGMGAVAGSVLGAPISTILMVFELTGDYELTIGVMIATVIASLITRYAFGFSFFTWQLDRRGLNLRRGREQGLLHAVHVCDVMRYDHRAVAPGAGMGEIRRSLQTAQHGELFVVDKDGRLHGTITLADLADAAFDTELDLLLNAKDVCRHHPPVLAEQDDLEAAMALIESVQEEIVAVVDDTKENRLKGYVRQRDVVRAYDRALLQARDEEFGKG